ncbi:hypothetical protein CHUAL_008955 [Chamberlinius hualienensis]
MPRMWYNIGKIKTPPECTFLYESALTIGDKVFAFHQRHLRQYTKIAELDLKTLKCTEFLSPNYDFSQSEGFSLYEISSYEKNIIMCGHEKQNEPGKLLKINTITHHVDIITLDYDDRFWEIEGLCIIKDHAYVILINVNFSRISIISVNLKTYEMKTIQCSDEELFDDLTYFKCINHESNIIFYHQVNHFIVIYDTVNDEWRKIESVIDNGREMKVVFRGVMINNEFVAFKRTYLPYNREWVEIFNFNSMKWRFGNFGGHPQFDDSFCSYFELNGKIATIKNSQNAINRSRRINQTDLPGSDEMEIYIMDLNPSLETLSATRVRELNLDYSDDISNIYYISIRRLTVNTKLSVCCCVLLFIYSVKMSRIWYSYCKLKTPPECLFSYQFALTIGDKVFVFYQRSTKIAELDLKTLKCTDFLSPDFDFSRSKGLDPQWACSYEENIILFGRKSQNEPGKLLKINTITHHVDNITLDYDDNIWKQEGLCIIKDHVYVILKNMDYSGVMIKSVNLKTFEIKEINYSIRGLKYFQCIKHESNLNFYHPTRPLIVVYDTVKDNWRKIKNVNFHSCEKKLFFTGVMVNSELVVFKETTVPYDREWVEIFNFSSMKWRFGDFGGHPQFDDSFCHYFELDGKIATIKITINKSDLPGDDEMEIYVLDFNPSLENLCDTKIRELCLDPLDSVFLFIYSVKMPRMWYSYCKIKTPLECLFSYQYALTIGDKVYAFYQRESGHHTKIAELDLKTLKCSKFVSPNYDLNEATCLMMCWACSYKENIIMCGHKSRYVAAKLLKINTITHHIDEILFDYEDRYMMLTGQCVIEDHAYVILIHRQFTDILIISINLKTFVTKEIQSSDEGFGYCFYHCAAQGTNIILFHPTHSSVVIYNTANDEWKQIQNVTFENAVDSKVSNDVMLNHEFVILKKVEWPFDMEWAEIFNLNTMKWNFDT